MLSRMKFEIEGLVAEMLDQLPASVWTSATTTFFDPAIGGGQFVKEIERRLRVAGHSESNINQRVFGFEESELHIRFAVKKHNLVGQYFKAAYDKILSLDDTVKFDIVVGNPPYRDGNKEGGQNKLYNQFSKKAIELLKQDGKIVFITPSAVLKKSKRFSLIGTPGLKVVNFNANNYFPEVGVNVCSWIIDQEYTGDITVISQDYKQVVPVNKPIYNPLEFDLEFTKIYDALRLKAKYPKDRMFKQNPVDTVNGRNKTKTAVYKYPVYKIGNDGEELVQYNKPVPKLHGKKKLVISTTKSFQESACIISTNDFDVNHVFIDVSNQKEVNNIKSFLFSNYFIEHSAKFKKLDGYGFNNSLAYLPPFDKTKTWSNEEVKTFIESFVS